MMTIGEVRLFARGASVYLKIAAGVIGIAAAVFWYLSARSTAPAAATSWNQWAAVATGLAVFLQAISALIDAWISPTASWG